MHMTNIPRDSTNTSASTTSVGSFAIKSYKAHEEGYHHYFDDGKLGSHALSWMRDDTVGIWCARRLWASVDPLLSFYTGSSWLTVGDGALGGDAHYLSQHGVRALASDISVEMLKEAKAAGYIEGYVKENAEALSLDDETFDFVFCKEAYHHFPRPYLALYEMLRVSRKGVVLIEPADMWAGESISGVLGRSIFRLLRLAVFGKRTPRHTYEEVGNYQYTMSIREAEKVALGINLPLLAYKKLNSYYRKGVEFAPAEAKNLIFAKARAVLAAKNTLASLKLLPWGLYSLVLFKSEPPITLISQLKRSGFAIRRLPRNPYL